MPPCWIVGWLKSVHNMIDQFGMPIAEEDAGRILD
jgi:hypothetical protein